MYIEKYFTARLYVQKSGVGVAILKAEKVGVSVRRADLQASSLVKRRLGFLPVKSGRFYKHQLLVN